MFAANFLEASMFAANFLEASGCLLLISWRLLDGSCTLLRLLDGSCTLLRLLDVC